MKLLTAYDKNYAEMAALTSKAAYCERWGIEYIEARIPETYDRPPAWYKIQLLLDTMKNSGEWLMWCDCDTVIMNGHQHADFWASLTMNYWLVIGEDENGINTGVFYIKDCIDAFCFLSDCYKRTEFLNHVWWEQAAVRAELEEMPSHFNVCIVPQLYLGFNVQPQNYKPGDFIVHFAGVPNRLFAIKKWIKEHETLEKEKTSTTV